MNPVSSGHRRALRARVAPALLLALVAALVGPALNARADNYRYWGYWQLASGAWSFAQKGPAQTVPADASVEGWRFAVDDGSGGRTPRVTPTFEQLCASTASASGKKRVGVVVDPGRTVDAETGASVPIPSGTCVVVATEATGSDVLAAAAATRVDKGLVCGIAGYPATGCGGQVAALTDAQKAPDTAVTLAAATPSATAAPAPAATTSSSPVGLIVLGIAALLFAVLVAVAVRRRRTVGA
ncbi:MAG: SCO2322 family protein [Dermatophilaceae bacterium]